MPIIDLSKTLFQITNEMNKSFRIGYLIAATSKLFGVKPSIKRTTYTGSVKIGKEQAKQVAEEWWFFDKDPVEKKLEQMQKTIKDLEDTLSALNNKRDAIIETLKKAGVEKPEKELFELDKQIAEAKKAIDTAKAYLAEVKQILDKAESTEDIKRVFIDQDSPEHRLLVDTKRFEVLTQKAEKLANTIHDVLAKYDRAIPIHIKADIANIADAVLDVSTTMQQTLQGYEYILDQIQGKIAEAFSEHQNELILEVSEYKSPNQLKVFIHDLKQQVDEIAREAKKAGVFHDIKHFTIKLIDKETGQMYILDYDLKDLTVDVKHLDYWLQGQHSTLNSLDKSFNAVSKKVEALLSGDINIKETIHKIENMKVGEAVGKLVDSIRDFFAHLDENLPVIANFTFFVLIGYLTYKFLRKFVFRESFGDVYYELLAEAKSNELFTGVALTDIVEEATRILQNRGGSVFALLGTIFLMAASMGVLPVTLLLVAVICLVLFVSIITNNDSVAESVLSSDKPSEIVQNGIEQITRSDTVTKTLATVFSNVALPILAIIGIISIPIIVKLLRAILTTGSKSAFAKQVKLREAIQNAERLGLVAGQTIISVFEAKRRR